MRLLFSSFFNNLSQKQQVKFKNNAYVFKMSNISFLIGIFGILFSFLIFFYSLSGFVALSYKLIALAVFMLLFGIVYSIIGIFKTIETTDESIKYSSLFTKQPIEIKWAEVDEVRCFKSTLVIRSYSKKISFDTSYIGLRYFVNIVRNKVDNSVAKEDLVDFERSIDRYLKGWNY